jgi:hypothetical protein
MSAAAVARFMNHNHHHHHHHHPPIMSRKRRFENHDADAPMNDIVSHFASALVTSSPVCIDERQVDKRARNEQDMFARGTSSEVVVVEQFEPFPTPQWLQPSSTRVPVYTSQASAVSTIPSSSSFSSSPIIPLPSAHPSTLYTYDQVCQLLQEERRVNTQLLQKERDAHAQLLETSLEKQRKACEKEYAAEFAARVEEMNVQRMEEERQREQCMRPQHPDDRPSYIS